MNKSGDTPILRGTKALTLAVFAGIGCVLLFLGRKDYFAMHVILDTTAILLSVFLALTFWEIGTRIGHQLFRWIAICFAITTFWELLHVIVGVDWIGPLADVAHAANILRPSTWPPTAYLLPLGIGIAILWIRRGEASSLKFSSVIILLGVVVFASSLTLPRYTSPLLLGISRPTLIFVPVLWGLVAWKCWSLHAKERILGPLALCAIVLGIANVAILYSHVPHDTPAMATHLGKVCGYLVLLLGVVQIASSDMLERQRAEDKFRGLLEAAPDSVVVVNREGKIVLVNAQTERMFGYAREELLNSEIEVLIPERFRGKHTGHRIGYFGDPKVRPMGAGLELYGLHKDGHEFAVEISLGTLQTAEGLLVSAAIRDITERKRAEEALQRSEEKFRLLVSGVRDCALFMLDEDGKVASWNAGAEQVKGYSAEEILDKNFSVFFLPEDQSRAAYSLKVAATQGQLEEEGWRVRKDGSRFWASTVLTALHDERNQLRGYAKITRDITAQRQADQKFRGLLEAAPDAVLVVDAEGEIVLVNAQVEKMFGYSREELLNREIEMLIPNRFREKHAGHRTVYFADPKVRPMGAGLELYGLRKNGSEFPVEISLGTLETEEGVLVSAAIRDVNERKQSEKQLKVQAAILQEQASLLDVAHDSIIVRDLKGFIFFWNRGAEQTYGWSKEEALNQDLHILLKTQFPQSLEEINAVLFREGRWEGELTHEKRNGARVVVASRWVLQSDKEQGSPRILEINRDITRRKEVEKEMRHQAAAVEQANVNLAEANKELEAFTYSVAHDLRAPLRHIQGFSRALMEDAGPVLTPDAQGLVQEILDGSKNMSELVDDLLSLARIGRHQLRVEVSSLGSLVEEVLRDLKREIKDRDIRWQIGGLPFAECDPGLMKQVFFNLLSNAVKYTRPREPAVTEVQQTETNGESVICIRDNGVGFSMKYADKLFGVFQRLHRKEDFEGTGVGLATVQRIIHKHGGRIWAEAEIDKGATFYFTLGVRRENEMPVLPVSVIEGER